MIFDFILGVLATIGCTAIVLVVFTYFSELYSNTYTDFTKKHTLYFVCEKRGGRK